MSKIRAKIDAKYANIEEMTQQPNIADNREIIKRMEDSIDNFISELKKANDALKKSIEKCNAKVNIDKRVKHSEEFSAQKVKIEELTQQEEVLIVKDLLEETELPYVPQLSDEEQAMSPEIPIISS